MRIMVAGGTGWVGSRLVARLVADDHDVVVLTRLRDRVLRRPWGDRVTIVEGDVGDARVVTDAMARVETAVHLVHAMQEGVDDFVSAERRAAMTVGQAAALVGVDHVVYLGGLANDTAELSPHMQSRIATGRLLADVGPPVTELRASIVLGAGSASYELIRFASLLPVPLLLHPLWATGRCQPIAIGDLLDVLVEVVTAGPRGQHRILEVGGPQTGVYHDLVDLLRAVRGEPALVMAPLPAPPPSFTGEVLGLLTPLDPGTVAPLIASLAHDSVVTGRHDAAFGATTAAEAMRLAVAGIGEAGSMAGDPDWVGADLDLELVAEVIGRLSLLPWRMLPRLNGRGVLDAMVAVVNAVRPT